MTKGKICVIEDDEVLLKVITAELADAGFEVSAARDGEEGLALLKSKVPDLVVLDILMPKKSGLDVLADIKKSPLLQHIPVIIMSALGSDEDIKEGLIMGAADYFVKSQHPIREIADKVEEFLLKNQHSKTPAGESSA